MAKQNCRVEKPSIFGINIITQPQKISIIRKPYLRGFQNDMLDLCSPKTLGVMTQNIMRIKISKRPYEVKKGGFLITNFFFFFNFLQFLWVYLKGTGNHWTPLETTGPLKGTGNHWNPKNHWYKIALVTTGPPKHTAGPPKHTTGPPKHTNGPPKHTTRPLKHTTGPLKHTTGPPKHTTGPPKHTTGPPKHTTGPLKHTTGPPKHTTGPPKHTTGPPKHTTGPPQHTTGPLKHTTGHP